MGMVAASGDVRARGHYQAVVWEGLVAQKFSRVRLQLGMKQNLERTRGYCYRVNFPKR